MLAKATESRRLYLQIADKVRALLAQPDFAPGGRLPAERALAEQLGVSRPSVREALVVLEMEGLVEIRQGSGVYVCAPAQRDAGAAAPAELGELGDSLIDIMNARAVLEGAIAASVAPFCTARSLKALRAIYDTMAREAHAGHIPIATDRAFHVAIAQMTGNDVLVRTVENYYDARHAPLPAKLFGHFENTKTWLAALVEHQAILEALEAHDPIQAQAAMQRHLRLSLERCAAHT